MCNALSVSSAAGQRDRAATDCDPVRHQHAGDDGLHLLGEIKQRFPEIPVMMVTAYGDEERRRRASDLGACEFLAKPVDFDHLKVQLAQLSTAAD
jgi:DNA-binding NtrC family response regulator